VRERKRKREFEFEVHNQRLGLDAELKGLALAERILRHGISETCRLVSNTGTCSDGDDDGGGAASGVGVVGWPTFHYNLACVLARRHDLTRSPAVRLQMLAELEQALVLYGEAHSREQGLESSFSSTEREKKTQTLARLDPRTDPSFRHFLQGDGDGAGGCGDVGFTKLAARFDMVNDIEAA
jgi:hypothetical protein